MKKPSYRHILSCPFSHAYRFKGGSAPKPPPAVPPVSQSSTEVSDAERQARLAATKKQGMKSTLLAGASGGGSSGLGNKSLLG